MPLDPDTLIADRAKAIDASGIRKVFDLAANLKNPINLSIGQPDFDVPQPVKDAAVQAVADGLNGYTQTQGMAALRQRVIAQVQSEYPAVYGESGALPDDLGLLITSGVSGGLVLAMLATIQAGDEVIVPDPYFVMYAHLVRLAGGVPVFMDCYPDFQITAERVEPLITPRTKLVIFNTPSNPTGVVAAPKTCQALAELCAARGVLLVSDEIYDAFCYEKVDGLLPSPVTTSRDTLMLRGYSKTYAMTGWRLGYAVGPRALINEMTKLQQYSFVCAPSMVQAAGAAALDVDMSVHVADYAKKRDRVVEQLAPHFELTVPGGAFYAFPKVPEHLGMSASAFVAKAIERNVLIIPGNVFSERDTHFRLSYACADDTLDQGLEVLVSLAR